MERNRGFLSLALLLLVAVVAGQNANADQQTQQPALLQQNAATQQQQEQGQQLSQKEFNTRLLSHLQQLMYDIEHQVEAAVPDQLSQKATTDRVVRARSAAHSTGMFPKPLPSLVESEANAASAASASTSAASASSASTSSASTSSASTSASSTSSTATSAKKEEVKAEALVETKATQEVEQKQKTEQQQQQQQQVEQKTEQKAEQQQKKVLKAEDGLMRFQDKSASAEIQGKPIVSAAAATPGIIGAIAGGPPVAAPSSSLASGLAQLPDYFSPEVMERGTLQSYLTTAEEAVATSARLHATYTQALAALFNQARTYKPQVAQWVRQQKEKSIETVENVKTTLAALEPQLFTLQNMVVDAKNKEAYYRRQANRLQVERQLQTSAPVDPAVEKATMPQAQYEQALARLQQLASQAQKVREEAEKTLQEKKTTVETGRRWLANSRTVLTAWLTRQQKHLRLVLLQARELAADWKVKLLHFSQVHAQAIHLVKQYTLALQRVAAEEKIHRLRHAWRLRARMDPDYANDPWERQDMEVKITNAQHEADRISSQMAYDSVPAPPTEWMSWLAADPNPAITAPLHLAPLATEALSAPIHFSPLKLSVPPAPISPPAALHKEAKEGGNKKEEGEEKKEEGGEEASFASVASQAKQATQAKAEANPEMMRFSQVEQPTSRSLPKDEVFAADAKPLLKGFPGVHSTFVGKQNVVNFNYARGGRSPIPEKAPTMPEVKELPKPRDWLTQHFRNSPIAAAYTGLTNSKLKPTQPNLKPGAWKTLPSNVPWSMRHHRLNLPPEYLATASAGIDAKYAMDLFHPMAMNVPSALAYHPYNPANRYPYYTQHPSFGRNAPTPRFSMPPLMPLLPSPPLPQSGAW